MPDFDKNLKVPFTDTGMRRRVYDKQDTDGDKTCIDRRIYTRKPNQAFTDTMEFIKFQTDTPNDTYVLLQSETNGLTHTMELETFQELLLSGLYNTKNHTITGTFYFIVDKYDRFSIVRAPEQTDQQNYQTHQRIMREIRSQAIDTLEKAAGARAEDIWNEIAADVVTEIMERCKPVHLNGWSEYVLRNAIGKRLSEILANAK